jgi:hypothetical protein
MALPHSVLSKFAWAERHRQAIRDARNRYFDVNEGKIFAESADQAVIVNAPEIPPEFPHMIGDFLQNLRSSLDYLTRELCIRSGCEGAEHASFPICKTPERFRSKLPVSLAGISPLMIAEIERLQPYNTGNHLYQSPLLVLNEFCNINKHRRIILTVLGVYLPHPFGTVGPMGEPYAEPVRRFEQMEVEGPPVADIAINEGIVATERVVPFTDWLSSFVMFEVFPTFEKFF